MVLASSESLNVSVTHCLAMLLSLLIRIFFKSRLLLHRSSPSHEQTRKCAIETNQHMQVCQVMTSHDVSVFLCWRSTPKERIQHSFCPQHQLTRAHKITQTHMHTGLLSGDRPGSASAAGAPPSGNGHSTASGAAMGNGNGSGSGGGSGGALDVCMSTTGAAKQQGQGVTSTPRCLRLLA